MRILITGIQGVLGTALHRELLSRGHTVFGCDLQHSYDPSIVRADIAEYDQIESVFTQFRPDIVYHLAGEFGRRNGALYPYQLWRTNCLGTQNIIRLCTFLGIRLIFASSSEAYGNLADYHETLHERLLTDNVPVFHNEYALTKWTGEKQIEIARNNHGLRAISLRFFNVYGEEPYSPYRSVICQFAYKLLRREPIIVYSGSRDFLYIADWSRTVANVADADKFDALEYTSYNIGNPMSISIHDLATIIAIECGYKAFEIPGELIRFIYKVETGNVKSKCPDIERARVQLDHKPSTRLVDGIAMTVKWMRQRYGL